MTVGDPATDDEIGWARSSRAEQQERVLGFLERAVAAKATIVTGGGAVGDRGFFVKPTIVTDVDAGRRDRPERGVRARRHDAALRVRRRGDRDGERRPLRARRLRLLGERRARDEGRGASSTSAPSGSTSTCSRSRPRCRTAASRSPGTARTCRCTRWRSTRGSSTSCVKLGRSDAGARREYDAPEAHERRRRRSERRARARRDRLPRARSSSGSRRPRPPTRSPQSSAPSRSSSASRHPVLCSRRSSRCS